MLYQDGKGKWLMPLDGPISGARWALKDGSRVRTLQPRGGTCDFDRFYEQAFVSPIVPNGGEYRSTFVNLGLIGTDFASVVTLSPNGGDYRSTIINVGVIATNTAAVVALIPNGGDFRKTLVNVGTLATNTAAITTLVPNGGTYAIP